jgi:hypothetical protein
MSRTRNPRLVAGSEVAGGATCAITGIGWIGWFSSPASGDPKAKPMSWPTLTMLVVGMLILLDLDIRHLTGRLANPTRTVRVTDAPSEDPCGRHWSGCAPLVGWSEMGSFKVVRPLPAARRTRASVVRPYKPSRAASVAAFETDSDGNHIYKSPRPFADAAVHSAPRGCETVAGDPAPEPAPTRAVDHSAKPMASPGSPASSKSARPGVHRPDRELRLPVENTKSLPLKTGD